MQNFVTPISAEESKSLKEGAQAGRVQTVTDAEWARFVLRGLISYHERITMGDCPELDHWKSGLEFALSCVEEKIPE